MPDPLHIITPDHMRTARMRVRLAQALAAALALALVATFPVSLVYWKGVHPAWYALVAAFVIALITRSFLRRHELEKLAHYAEQRRELICPRCYEPVTESADGLSRCDPCRSAWPSDTLLAHLQNPLTTPPPIPSKR